MADIAVVLVLHDDHYFLDRVIASFRDAGPVLCYISRLDWTGATEGCWERAAEVAASAGAEVVLGDWADESTHRRYAYEETLRRGYAYALIPDGDEVIEPKLLESLFAIAKSGLADKVRCRLLTYWKSIHYRIQPPEELAPAILIDLRTVQHQYIREFSSRRELTLGFEYGCLHHLSYAGPDERILRKLFTSSHRNEFVLGWYERVWCGWNDNRQMQHLHPTHPHCFGYAERVEVPDILQGVWDERTLPGDPEVPANWPTVSVVIPLYGGEEDIALCLKSLAPLLPRAVPPHSKGKSKGKNAPLESNAPLIHEVIVVDDVSPDNAAQVAAELPWVQLIRNEANLGFAGACNRGFVESTGKVILFLNSDTAVTRAGIIRLVETLMSSGTVGAAGPMTNYAGYSQPTFSTYSNLDGLEGFAQDFAHRAAEDTDVPMLVGFALAVKREVLEEVGLFDTRFKRGMYEDSDLCFRIQSHGYRCRLSTRAFVHHTGSRSLARLDISPNRLLEENRKRYDAKWREVLESGYASHLPGQSAAPIVFRPERHPERLKREIARLCDLADVTLCMIARDEARCIADCLLSVRPFVKQMIVVDTGSTDRTKEIAAECGAEVHDFEWVDSFAAARNESLKYARGRWILWLDADDVISAATGEAILRQLVEMAGQRVAFLLPIHFSDGPMGTQVDHIKIFPANIPGLQFEGRIHEQIIRSLGNIPYLRIPGAYVHHKNYDYSPEGQEKKRIRDEKLLLLDLADTPGHPYKLFNLGMTAYYLGEFAEAIDWLTQCVEACDPRESQLRKAFALLGHAYEHTGQPELGLATFEKGLAAIGDDPELRYALAMALAAKGDLAGARHHFETMPTSTEGLFVSLERGILGPLRLHHLADVCWDLGDLRAAKAHYKEAAGMGLSLSAVKLFQFSLSLGDFLSAQEAMTAFAQTEGENEEWAAMLIALAEARGENSEEALWRALARNPHSLGPNMILGRTMMSQGDVVRAAPLLTMLDAFGIAEGTFLLGKFAIHYGRFAEALDHMRRAHVLNPGHEGTLAEIAALEKAIEMISQETTANEAAANEAIGEEENAVAS